MSKGVALKEMRVGCKRETRTDYKRLFLLPETGWEVTAVRLPGWKKGFCLDADTQFMLQMVSARTSEAQVSGI